MLNPDGKLTIDLGALKDNYALIQSQIGPDCTIGAVVKANAFGLGAQKVTGALIKAGCNDFFVASPNEALDLREKFKDCNIYILSGFYQSRAGLYIEHNLIKWKPTPISAKSTAANSPPSSISTPA